VICKPLGLLYKGSDQPCQVEYRFKKLEGEENFPLGAEGAGVVLAHAADVVGLPPGQPVACNSATFSEHAIVAARLCYPIHAASAAAAAVTLSGVFASVAINETGQVKPGQRVLITAGAGAAFFLQ
jgi:NADPH:quinone reductase-like Zn-dependent oxidoreductase